MTTRIIRLYSLGDLYPDSPIPLSRDIYWMLTGDDTVMLAHACTNKGHWDGTPKWMWRSADLHTRISLDPLHLEPSIGWTECCGRHGFIRHGEWEPAGDGGWSPTN